MQGYFTNLTEIKRIIRKHQNSYMSTNYITQMKYRNSQKYTNYLSILSVFDFMYVGVLLFNVCIFRTVFVLFLRSMTVIYTVLRFRRTLILLLTFATAQTLNYPVSECFHLLNGFGVGAGACMVGQSDQVNFKITSNSKTVIIMWPHTSPAPQ